MIRQNASKFRCEQSRATKIERIVVVRKRPISGFVRLLGCEDLLMVGWLCSFVWLDIECGVRWALPSCSMLLST